MKAHIDAIKAMLAPYGKDVYFADAVKYDNEGKVLPLTYPYVLLWSGTGRMTSDELDGVQDDLNDILGVTTVAASADATLVAALRVRSYLLGKQPVVEGRYVQPLRLFDSQQVTPDREVTIPGTNRHPAFAVDLYPLISEPA